MKYMETIKSFRKILLTLCLIMAGASSAWAGTVADVNGDGLVNVSDVTSLVNIILGNSQGGTIVTGYVVRNVSPVVGYIDDVEVFTWGGQADIPQE